MDETKSTEGPGSPRSQRRSVLAPAPPPQGPPARLQKAVGSGNEMWALCISLCLQKDPLAQGHWAACVGNLWKPEVGRQSPITVRRWLLIFRPAGRPLRALFPRKPGSLDSTARAGSGAGRKVLCQGTQRQTLSLFPGRCCPLLVKSQPVPLCWSVLPKLLTVLSWARGPEVTSDTLLM